MSYGGVGISADQDVGTSVERRSSMFLAEVEEAKGEEVLSRGLLLYPRPNLLVHALHGGLHVFIEVAECLVLHDVSLLLQRRKESQLRATQVKSDCQK